MKPLILSIFLFVSSQILGQTLFYDDFEESISNDATFTKWTTENIEGWHYWHIIPGQHMRFESTDLNQNDWLVTKPINCSGVENLKVNFSHFFYGPKVPPRLFYTNQYNGNAGQSVWKELIFSFGANENHWYQSDDFIIENPGNVIYFAFHYQAAANAGTYFLLDNFSVKEYITPPIYDLVGSSEHFEFYTNEPENTEFGSEISESLENMYQKYVDNWNCPSGQDYIDSNIKTKVYLTQKEYMDVASDILEIKAGYFNSKAHEIYLTPLDSPEKLKYYKDIIGLTKNTFAKYALALKSVRDFNNILPEYFLEGFGLYEQGYRPDRDSVVSFVNESSTQHSHDLFLTFRDFQNNSIKDIIVAYVQRSVLFHGGITLEGIFPETWNKFLLHFYIAEEEDRLMRYGSTEYFDIYCTSYDTIYIDSMKVWLERIRVFYNETYEMNFKNLVGLFVMKDAQMGMDITGYGSFTGGTGGINLSPRDYADYPWLLAHEIGHVYNGIMSPQYMWVGFHHEGMANLSGYLQYGNDWRPASVQIDFILNYYQQNFGRPPTLTEFYTNPHHQQMGTYYGIHPYICGLEFYRMLYENYGGVKIKEFFQAGHDCTVFGKDSVVIHNEYITKLKHIRNLIPLDTIFNLPFYDSMGSFDNGWSRPCINNNLDNWDTSDDGFNGGNCMEFQTYNDKNQPIVTWLVSPKFDISQLHDISTSFDYFANGNDIALEVYYAQDFKGNTEQTNWNFLYDCNALDGGWHNTDDISFECSFDSVFIGIKFLTQGNQWDRVKIDNFEVKIKSPFDLPAIATNDATSESQTSAILNGAILSDGGTSITQRGFYWSSSNTSPNADDNVEIVEGTTGSFNKTIENLTAGTTYYFRAFAINSEGTTLGEVKQFKILIPEVLTELPFFDDFEEITGDGAIFTKWTTENIEGWHYWHIIPGQHMRFENTDLNQNDWLVTKPISCSGAENLKVNFSHLYHANKVPPKLYYTSQYNGNASQSTWNELTYSFGANENQWYQSDDFIIENPGDVIYFAFHYLAAANAGTYFLLDNFSVKSYTPPIPFVLVGSSDHFEFYTNIPEQSNYYLTIQNELENEYMKLSSYWNRPLGDPIFDATTKIKVYYCNRDDVPQVSEKTPDWKCGFHNTTEKAIFISLPSTSEMYSDLTFLAIDEFAQLAVHRKLQRDGENNCPEYFLEGFGLYEAGFKPRVDSIKKYMEDLQKPQVSFIQDISNLPATLKKDVAVSLIEAQTLGGWGYDGIGPGASSFFDNDWGTHLKYFYLNEDEERFQLLLSSTHFTFYAFPRDQKFAQEFIDTLENVYTEYVNLFDIEHNHPIAVILFSDETTGRTLGAWGSGSANGCSSLKVGFWDVGTSSLLTEESFCGILKHELSHNLSSHFNTGFGFYNEGIAVHLSKYPYKLSDIYQNKDRIARVFDFYLETYGHLPTMDEFVNDPYLNLGGFVEEDIYYFAPIFYYFIFENYNYENVKNFIINHYDFEGAFGKSKLEIEAGYIAYLENIINPTIAEPEVATLSASQIQANSAVLNGSISSDGGSSITQRGFYWSSTNTSPNASDHVETVAGTTGNYSFELTGLSPSTSYYYRAFATNSEGTAVGVGDVMQFETLSSEDLAELPFSDDFSQNYENWTTVSVTGDDVWHISNDDGIDFGKCARFYKGSNPGQQNDDWLVSPVFDTEGISNLAINFKYSYNVDGVAPDFFYASTFDGNPSNSEWTQIDKEFWDNSMGWQDALIKIENPGETFVFAVRYEVMPTDEYYFLMDKFKAESYEPDGISSVQLSDCIDIFITRPVNLLQVNTTNSDLLIKSIELIDITGRVALKYNAAYQQKVKIQLSGVKANSIYILKITTNKGVNCRKMNL